MSQAKQCPSPGQESLLYDDFTRGLHAQFAFSIPYRTVNSYAKQGYDWTVPPIHFVLILNLAEVYGPIRLKC